MMPASRQILSALLLVASMGVTGCSSFRLTSKPPADVYENGKKVGVTPYSFLLLTGSRSFTLKCQGYVEQDVRITSLDSKQQHVSLQWVGRTQVDSIPEGARVLRLDNNELLGVTPCSLYLSRPVDVVFKLDGFEEAERQIVPNRVLAVELKPTHGFKSVQYRDIFFTSRQGPVAIYDRTAGQRIGVTPVRLKVEAGSELEFRRPGYEPGRALVSRNAPGRMDIRLKPLAAITLIGPLGAEVYRAGEDTSIGRLPILLEVDGPELYEVKKEGCYDRTVAVGPGSPPRIEVKLEEIPYKTILTDPPGGDVYRLGGLQKLGTAPFTTVVSGECVFEIRKEGYDPCVIGVGPSSPDRLSVQLSPLKRNDTEAAEVGGLDSALIETF